MNTKWLWLLAIVAVAGCDAKRVASESANGSATTPAASVESADAAPDTAPNAATNAAGPDKDFELLSKNYAKQLNDFHTAYAAAPDEERPNFYRTKFPSPQTYVSEFMHIAQENPGTIAAENSLFWVVENSRRPDEQKAALDLIFTNHLDSERMEQMCFRMLYARGDDAARERLEMVIDNTPHKKIKAVATYCLASFLRLNAKDDGNKEEYMSLLRKVSDEYSDIEFRGRPISKMAEGAIFEIENLKIGEPVPDIVGEDLNGESFKLSDYRGKIVMLDFWGNWSADCRANYPHVRSLIKKLADKPFVLIGVNSDKDREQAREFVKTQDLNWRSFWNGEKGINGPISTQWNIIGWPSIFLIDHEGVLRYKKLPGPKQLEFAITKLLDDMGHKVDLSKKIDEDESSPEP